jgi:prevent-host-death family protein
VPLSEIKVSFSRYVRDVQVGGRAITITHHGRDAALLAPLTIAPRPMVREPVDPRPLGRLKLTPLPGRGASAGAIRRALDEERDE